MPVRIVNKNSTVQDKVPVAGDLEIGEIAVNANVNSPAAYIKDSAGNIVKLAGSGSVGDDWTRTGTALSPKTAGDTIQFSAGTAALPGITPVGDATTGIYSSGAHEFAIATNATQRLVISSSGQIFSTGLGTAANPALSFVGDTDTGIYSPGANQLAIATSGSERIRIGANGEIGLGGANYGTSGQVLTSSGTGAAVTWVDPGATVTTSDTAPTSPSDGDLWYDSVGGRLYVYYQDPNGSQWVDAAPPSGAGVPTKIEVGNTKAEITDTGSNGAFAVTTEGTQRLIVDSSGRLGLGTGTPSEALTVGSGNVQITGGQLALGSLGSSGLQFINNGTIGTVDSIPLILRTAATERARIDTSGRLLVGTSTSASTGEAQFAKFQVKGNTFSSGEWGTVAILSDNLATSGLSNNNLIGGITFADAIGSNFCGIKAAVDGTPGANDYPGRLVFSTTADGASSPTERMRITNSGQVLINTASPANAASKNAIHYTGIPNIGLEINDTNGITSTAIQFQRAGVAVGSIVTTSGTAYNTSSDYRLKENIVPLTNATDRLNQLQVHRFNFITDPGKTVDGFLAHEAQAVVPECVTGTKDEVNDEGNPVYQGIDQSKLVPLLTAALQEALAEIESLKARVTALEP